MSFLHEICLSDEFNQFLIVTRKSYNIVQLLAVFALRISNTFAMSISQKQNLGGKDILKQSC